MANVVSTMKPFYTNWLLNASLCLVVMLTVVSCISPAKRAKLYGEILRQRAEIKTLRLSIYLNDYDWRQMKTNDSYLTGQMIVFGPAIGSLGAELDALEARKDLAVLAQLKSRYETNFFRCLSETLVEEIQSNTAFQVTDSRTAPADANLILLVQNVTYRTDQRSTLEKISVAEVPFAGPFLNHEASRPTPT